MCNPDGGIIDDLLVYRRREDLYMLVVNAANIEKDFAWIRQFARDGAALSDISEETALLAIQGPNARTIVQNLTETPLAELKYYHFLEVPAGGFPGQRDVLLSHTGYTGEPGLEIYCQSEDAVPIWHALMEAGASHGLKPAGLGARDTLRLEAGFCLYGNDITDATSPYDAGLGWVTKLDKGDFVGKEPLERIKAESPARKLVGFVMEDRGIPRHDFPIVDSDGREIGVVTSGTQSPVLRKGIGLGYVPNDEAFTAPGTRIGIDVRGTVRAAVVTEPPFHKA
jgi:aminomethyltransferase